jgi:hypothetical protein
VRHHGITGYDMGGVCYTHRRDEKHRQNLVKKTEYMNQILKAYIKLSALKFKNILYNSSVKCYKLTSSHEI